MSNIQDNLFSVIGTELAVRKLNKWREGKITEESRALDGVAREVLSIAQGLCPVDTGDLRDSGRIDSIRSRGNGVQEIKVIFGGGGVDYADDVHNDPSSPGSKFLTRAVEQAVKS